jgi:diacylglycerol kinase family enzyme
MSSSSPVRASATSPASEGRITAFVNPHSPKGADARAALVQAGVFEVVDLEPQTVRSQIESALTAGAKRVLVAGGDGTLGTAAAALLGTDRELAVVAAGTLNHFVKDHGLPEDVTEAIGTALSDGSATVDAGVVSQHAFLNTASVGMYVRYVRARERMERYVGYRLASVAALVATFLRPRYLAVELQVEGVVRSYRTPLLFVGVGERELKAPSFGARVQGGRRGLHVIIVRGRRPARLLTTAMAAAARGVDHVSASPDVDSFMADSCTVRVRSRTSLTIGVDGELMRLPAPLEFRVARDALRVVGAVPPADVVGGNSS